MYIWVHIIVAIFLIFCLIISCSFPESHNWRNPVCTGCNILWRIFEAGGRRCGSEKFGATNLDENNASVSNKGFRGGLSVFLVTLRSKVCVEDGGGGNGSGNGSGEPGGGAARGVLGAGDCEQTAGLQREAGHWAVGQGRGDHVLGAGGTAEDGAGGADHAERAPRCVDKGNVSCVTYIGL